MTVTREKLYEEIWAEPMMKVAARYQASGSFLSRVCERLRVPSVGAAAHEVAAARGVGVHRGGELRG
jgi:hypothetical protein